MNFNVSVVELVMESTKWLLNYVLTPMALSEKKQWLLLIARGEKNEKPPNLWKMTMQNDEFVTIPKNIIELKIWE